MSTSHCTLLQPLPYGLHFITWRKYGYQELLCFKPWDYCTREKDSHTSSLKLKKKRLKRKKSQENPLISRISNSCIVLHKPPMMTIYILILGRLHGSSFWKVWQQWEKGRYIGKKKSLLQISKVWAWQKDASTYVRKVSHKILSVDHRHQHHQETCQAYKSLVSLYK